MKKQIASELLKIAKQLVATSNMDELFEAARAIGEVDPKDKKLKELAGTVHYHAKEINEQSKTIVQDFVALRKLINDKEVVKKLDSAIEDLEELLYRS